MVSIIIISSHRRWNQFKQIAFFLPLQNSSVQRAEGKEMILD